MTSDTASGPKQRITYFDCHQYYFSDFMTPLIICMQGIFFKFLFITYTINSYIGNLVLFFCKKNYDARMIKNYLNWVIHCNLFTVHNKGDSKSWWANYWNKKNVFFCVSVIFIIVANLREQKNEWNNLVVTAGWNGIKMVWCAKMSIVTQLERFFWLTC